MTQKTEKYSLLKECLQGTKLNIQVCHSIFRLCQSPLDLMTRRLEMAKEVGHNI